VDDSKYPSNANHFSPEISENSNIKSSIMNYQLSSHKDPIDGTSINNNNNNSTTVNQSQDPKQRTLKKSASTLFNKKSLVLQNSQNAASEKPANQHFNNFLLNSENQSKGNSKSLDRVKSPGNLQSSKSELNLNVASPKRVLLRDRSEQSLDYRQKLMSNHPAIENKFNPLSALNNFTNRNNSQKNIKLQQSSHQNSASFRSKMNDKSVEIKKKTIENTSSRSDLKMSLNKPSNNSNFVYNNKLKIPDNNIKSLKYNNFTKPKQGK
jgi:hypothetical protein